MSSSGLQQANDANYFADLMLTFLLRHKVREISSPLVFGTVAVEVSAPAMHRLYLLPDILSACPWVACRGKRCLTITLSHKNNKEKMQWVKWICF